MNNAQRTLLEGKLAVLEAKYGLKYLRPFIQIEGSDFRDVRAKISVNSGALDAHQHAQVDTSPFGICTDRNESINKRNSLHKKIKPYQQNP